MAAILDAITTYASNFRHNITHAFVDMSVEKYIRLVAVVGAYALLRPFFIRIGTKIQEKQHEKEFAAGAALAYPDRKPEISANQLRGQAEPEDSDDEEEGETETTGAEWGKKARKRQRQILKRVLEAEQKIREKEEEEESDKEIEQFLVDNYGVNSLTRE